MKITKEALNQIIKEEITKILSEKKEKWVPPWKKDKESDEEETEEKEEIDEADSHRNDPDRSGADRDERNLDKKVAVPTQKKRLAVNIRQSDKEQRKLYGEPDRDMDETLDFYNPEPSKDQRTVRRVTPKGTVEKPTGPRGEEPPKKSASSIRGKLVPEANDVQGMTAPMKDDI